MRLHSCHFQCQHHFVHWGCCRRVPKQKCPWSGFERKDKKNEKWVSMWTSSALHWTFRKKKRENSSQLPTPPRVSVIENWKFDLNSANTVLISAAGRPVEPHGKCSFTFLPHFLPSALHFRRGGGILIQSFRSSSGGQLCSLQFSREPREEEEEEESWALLNAS